jgi:hypothetical protein
VAAIGLMLCAFTPASAAPTLQVLAPAEGAVLDTSTVTVEFKTSELAIVKSNVPLADYGKRPDANTLSEGHLHLTLDLWPLVVWESANPYTFMNVPPGEHQLKVELVNNDHSSWQTAVSQVIRFRTTAAAPVRMPATGGTEQLPALLGFFALCVLAAGVALRRNGV